MPMLKEMKPTYKIFVLDDDDYLGLHKYVPQVNKKDLDDSLGFANPKTKEAYVRRTLCKEMDDETIMHEAMELISKHSEHEIDGIRWKKGGVARFIVPALLSLIPGVGPILAAASSVGMGQYAQARHPEQLGKPSVLSGLGQAATGYFGGKALAGGISGGIQGGTQAGAGFLSKAGGIVSGVGKGAMIGSAGIQPNILGMTPAATTPAAGGLANQFAAQQATQFGTPLTLGGQTSLVTGGAGGLAASPLLGATLGAGIGSTLAPTTLPSVPLTGTSAGLPPIPTAGQVAPAATPLTGAIPKTFMEQAKGLVTPQNILGAGSLLASTMGQQPQFTMPSQFTELQNKLMAGQALSPLGQQAQMELGNILKSTPTELYPTANTEFYNAALRRTRESYAEAAKQLTAQYNLYGVAGSGEHLQALSDLQEELARTESALYAETEQRNYELGMSQKYSAIQQALGVEQNVLNDLLGLTGLSVQVASQMYFADVNDVTELRKALGTLGSELLIRGTTGQMKGGQGVTINLGANR